MMCCMSATARAVDHSAGRLEGHPTPTATRLSARRWRDPRVVVGVGLVALSVLLGTTLLGAADDTVAVWRGRGGPRPGRAPPTPHSAPRPPGRRTTRWRWGGCGPTCVRGSRSQPMT